ncbi:hypothetical protein [Deinococcus sp.]|uniref:lipocalin family protein n=1 Tax=Deinococcus sp. TaxID=47478 RepID=UPI003CC5AE58
MRSISPRLANLLAALLCVWLSNARAATFGNYVYTLPPGWTQSQQNGTLILTPPDLKAGERASVRLTPGAALQGDLSPWLSAQMQSYNAGAKVVTQTPIQAQTDSSGQPLLASVAVVQINGQPEWRFFIAGHPGNRAELLVIVTSSYQVFTAHQNELDAFSNGLDYANVGSGTSAATGGGKVTPPPAKTPAAQAPTTQTPATQSPATQSPATQPPTSGAPPTTSNLGGSVPVPDLPRLVAAGLDPQKQAIPDEFRCYLSYNSSDYSKPAFALQILPGNRYRAPGGEGSYQMVQTNSGSLSYLRWQGGPLAGTDDAFLLFDRRYGQRIQLDGVGKDGLRLYCYQRGGAENHALVGFRRADPQVGAYPCRSTDGKNTDLGALEILAGRAYRYRGGTGKYTVNILGRQSDDFGDVDFIGGPLDNSSSPYSEDRLGERHFSGLPTRNARCSVIAKPIAEPRFGPNKAPAPPAGAGGLEGAYSYYVQNFYPNARLDHFFYIFFKNGYVYTDDPKTSLADADCTKSLPSGLPLCQVYTIKNGTITIGNHKPVKWEGTQEGYKLGGREMNPVKPLGNLKLAGEYKAVSSFTAVVGSGGGLFEDFLTFRKDGTFSIQHTGGVSINTTSDGTALGDVTGGVYSSTDRRNSGSYSFSGNTLTLKYGDGRVEQKFVYLPQLDKQGKPDLEWLYLDGSNYFLEDPKKK